MESSLGAHGALLEPEIQGPRLLAPRLPHDVLPSTALPKVAKTRHTEYYTEVRVIVREERLLASAGDEEPVQISGEGSARCVSQGQRNAHMSKKLVPVWVIKLALPAILLSTCLVLGAGNIMVREDSV
ncbi:hypothetical protein DFH07DRAFT_964204 [Mycena maculata]|uniref:Uncharacterized protein n=1 Tax=Mycena maculata TaxID=230809 RepID=A0AAD7IHI2_9AGAR|nr:hypothetical protein DFH07DRAFT_964204 [Mycena maculata]